MSIEEIYQLIQNWDELPMTVDAMPKQDRHSEEDDSFVRFLVENCIVHPELERELDEEEINEDFMNDEYSENCRPHDFWDNLD